MERRETLLVLAIDDATVGRYDDFSDVRLQVLGAVVQCCLARVVRDRNGSLKM